MVVQQEPQQTAHQCAGEQPQLLEAGPDHRHHQEEQTHRHGHTAAQSIQTVRDIHGVDGAHDHKGREHQIHDPRQHDVGVPEGNIQVGAQHPLVPHQAQECHRRRQLQNKLLRRGQAGVLVVLHLLIVVDISDNAEYQREQVHIQVYEAAGHHPLPAQHDDGEADADDEHQPAHGGGALLRHVPGGPNLLDGLSRLQLYQRRYQQLACDGGDDKAYRDRQHDLHNSHTILLLPSAPRGGLFFISAFPSGARPR